MTENKKTEEYIPMNRLDAYRVAKEFIRAVVACQIGDAKLREQGVRAAQSCCLNIAEATGRGSKADRARVFHIARGECCEAIAAVEIAEASNTCSVAHAATACRLGTRLYVILNGLIRR